MICPHATSVSENANACSLGLYGGRPSKGVCAYCISRGENTPENAANQPIQATPSIPQMLKTASKAAVSFASSGFTTTDPKTLARREATCRSCDMWDAAAINNTGRCKKCGCSTWAKLRMASEKCPLDKW
jgi:Tfp pilus assembly protein FimT